MLFKYYSAKSAKKAYHAVCNAPDTPSFACRLQAGSMIFLSRGGVEVDAVMQRNDGRKRAGRAGVCGTEGTRLHIPPSS